MDLITSSIQIDSTDVIAITAVAMVIFAWANLKNARAMKNLEEANLKMAIWSELKEIIIAVAKYTSNVIVGNSPNTLPALFANISVAQYAPYFSGEGDEFLPHLEKLVNIGEKLQSLHAKLPPTTGPDDHEKWVSKEKKLRMLLINESNEIHKLLKRFNNLAISTLESLIIRILMAVKK